MQTHPLRSAALALALAAVAALTTGCFGVATWVAMPFLYDEAAHPDDLVVNDLPYRIDGDADPKKHRLDLYLPRAPGRTEDPWPVMVFVHGGGWTTGDKALRAAGRDVYGNIGRYFASRGIGVAVANYRLQYDVTWKEQVADVADAVAWVADNVAPLGGDPDAIFLVGHSAGAQLVTRVALDRETAAQHGVPGVCGLVSVSGAGFDLADPGTYALGASPEYYERRFRNGDPTDDWQSDASPVTYLSGEAPPALHLYAARDWPSIQRQVFLLNEAFARFGVDSSVVRVPGQDHYTIVLTLSRDDVPEGAPRILEFVEQQLRDRC